MKRSIEHFKHSIEIDEAINLHKKGWIIQRIGWSFFALVVISAILGLFGNGPLSYKSQESNGNLLEYEKFGRFQSEMELKLTVRPQNGTGVVSVPKSYLEEFDIEKVFPEPREQKVVGENHVFTFTGDSPITVVVYLLPQQTGTINTTIHANNQPFQLSQYIYP